MGMKVLVSVPGRFHAFNLASELSKRGYLSQLITSYPRSVAGSFQIPLNKVNSILIGEVIRRGWGRLPAFLQGLYNPQFLVLEIFDMIAQRKIREADIAVFWPGSILRQIRKAKEMGAITIAEGSSSYVLYQHQILEEEYQKFNIPFRGAHPKVLESVIKEYTEVDYISVPSSFVKKTFLDYGFEEKKLLLNPYGVDIEEFRQVPKEDSVFRVIFVGGMTLRKGVHYLLQAFTELNLPDAELLLVGAFNDEIKPFFKKYEGKFRWVGHRPQKELYKYYSQGNVFVMPSIEEGMAMVQLQAMACGLPLICTPNTGGEDLIEEGKEGFVVPIRSVEALKEKILFFYKNPDIAYQMGQNAKKKVEENFTWQKYGERMVEIYKKILNN